MKFEDMKWPNGDLLLASARARLKDLRKLVSFYRFSEDDLNIVQNELDILAKMVNPKKVKKHDDK